MKYSKGFTLTELMIAMVLGVLVLGGAIGVFLGNQQTSRANMALGELQNIARLSFQLMSQDIRGASFMGCNNVTRVANALSVGGVRPDWANVSIGGIEGFAAPVASINGRTPAADTEAIRLMFAKGASSAIAAYDGSNFQLNVNPEIVAGEIALACDDAFSSIFQASEVDAARVTHNVSGLNGDANLGFLPEADWAPGLLPPRFFSRNGMLMQFESVAWFVAPSASDSGVKSLYRASLIGDRQVNEEVLFGVSDLSFRYFHRENRVWQSAAATTAAAAWGRIMAVEVTITLDDAILQGMNVAADMKTFNFTVVLRNRV